MSEKMLSLHNVILKLIQMKNLKIIVLLLSFVAFVSCSKDDDGGSNIDPNVSLAGSWEFSDLDTNKGKMKITSEGTSIEASFKVTGKDYAYQAVFTEEPNYVTSAGTFIMVLTISVLNETDTEEQLIEDYGDESNGLTGVWSIEGNKLVVTNDDNQSTYTITELTENRLKFQMDLSQSEFISGIEGLEGNEGVGVEISGQLVYTFTRN